MSKLTDGMLKFNQILLKEAEDLDKASQYTKQISLIQTTLEKGRKQELTFLKAQYIELIAAPASELANTGMTLLTELAEDIARIEQTKQITPNEIELAKQFQEMLLTAINFGGDIQSIAALGIKMILTGATMMFNETLNITVEDVIKSNGN